MVLTPPASRGALAGGTCVDLVKAASVAGVRGGTERTHRRWDRWDHRRCSIKIFTKCNVLCYNVFYSSTHTYTLVEAH